MTTKATSTKRVILNEVKDLIKPLLQVEREEPSSTFHFPERNARDCPLRSIILLRLLFLPYGG